MDLVNEASELLHTHANRDKVVSLASYLLKLWGASSGRDQLLTASARLATARAALRLFDDAAAIRNVAAYGLGEKDGILWGTLGVASGALTLAYLQAEKAVFLLDTGLLTLPQELEARVRLAHKLFWSLSAFVGFVRSLRSLHVATQTLKSADASPCAGARYSQAAWLSAKLLLDTAHAVSWLPRGWLWGGTLPAGRTAAIATASALIALLTHYNAKKLASSSK